MSLDTLRQHAVRMYRFILLLLLSPLFFLLLRFSRVRIIDIPFGIGELAMDMDLFVKEEALGLRPAFRSIIFLPWHNPAKLRQAGVNLYLVSLFERHFWLPIRIRNRLVLELLRPVYTRDHMLIYRPDTPKILQRYVSVVQKWGDRPPVLELPPLDLERGWRALESLGIPRTAWFVCIHARERVTKPSKSYHNYRDVDIETYAPACQEIIRRGGWVLRMGDSAMRPFRPFEKVIDYIHTDAYSDFMDIFLSSHCRFFLGCNSGLAAVPTAFGVPLATTNGVPVAPLTYAASDIGIMKMAWSDAENRFVRFDELLAPDNYRPIQTQDWLAAHGWRLIDNSPEEILELAREMLDRTENPGISEDEADEARQRSLKGLLVQNFHYAYGTRARMGRAFLARHADLLPSGDSGD